MRERKRKRIESLVDKYARKRGMEVPDLVEEANGFAKHEDEGVATLQEEFNFVPIPGVFEDETLVEHFRIFIKRFSQYANALLKLIAPHISQNSLSLLQNDVLFFGKSKINVDDAVIDDYNVWLEVEKLTRETCSSIVPFIAQLVKIEVAPSSFDDPRLVKNGDTALTKPCALGKIKVTQIIGDDRDWIVSACAMSDNLLAVGVSDGSIFLCDLDITNGNVLSSISVKTLGVSPISNRIKKRRIFAHRTKVERIVYAKHEEFFLSCDSSCSICYWNASTGAILQTYIVRLSPCLDIDVFVECQNNIRPAISHRTISFLTAHDDCAARLFYVGSSGYRRLLVHEYPVKITALRRITAITVTRDENAIRLWDLNTAQVLRVMEPLGSSCVSVNMPGSERLYTILEDGTFLEFDISKASILRSQQISLSTNSKHGPDFVIRMQQCNPHTFVCATNQNVLHALRLDDGSEHSKVLFDRINVKELNKAEKRFKICCCYYRIRDDCFTIAIA